MADNPSLTIVGKSVGDEDLRRWLDDYIKEHPQLTTAELSRGDHIGMSKTALDSYREGLYFVSKDQGGLGVNPQNTKIEIKIRAYRDKVEGTVRHGYKNTFIETRSWQQFQHACKVAIEEQVIVIVYAKPGNGKSRCLQQYSNEKMKTRPIDVLCSPNITTRYFVQKIAQAVGVPDHHITARLEDEIAKRLKKNPRPLFVDQANYLHEKALGTICYLWETARTPIVLIGTHDLAELFNKSSLTEDVRAQLTSRIAMHYPLMELSLEELKTIVVKVLGQDRASGEVVGSIMRATNGNHRHLDMILPRLSEMIKKNEPALEAKEINITDLVDRATSRLMVG